MLINPDVNTFNAKLYPKNDQKWVKKSKIMKFSPGFDVVSDSKLNVEHDAHTHFA